MKVRIIAPLPVGPGGGTSTSMGSRKSTIAKGASGRGPAAFAASHGVSMFDPKKESKMGSLKRLKKETRPYTPKQSAKIEKNLRAGGSGGKVYKKRLASISKTAGKGMKHRPAGSPAGGQFF